MAHNGYANDDTQNSAVSHLSALDNPTDDFDKVIAQHARDAKRLNDALHGNIKSKAFSRARPSHKSPMDRAGAALPGDNVDRERHNSLPEPPVNVPREWGTKGTKRDRWLDRLTAQQDDQHTAGALEEGATTRHRVDYNGDHSPIDDWEAVADRPMPSVEDTPPSMRKHQQRRSSSQQSVLRLNEDATGEPFDTDDEFAAASMIASTPALSRHNRKIDQLSLLEIEDMQQREVAKQALDQISEHSPNSNALRKSSSSRIRARALVDETRAAARGAPARPTTAPGRTPSPSKIPKRRQSLYGNKENVPVNGEKTAGFKASETVEVDRATQAVGERSKLPQRPGHERNKSMNLLRTLARVSSMSPSPGKNRAEAPRPLSRGSSSASVKTQSILAGPHGSDGSADSSPRSNMEKKAVAVDESDVAPKHSPPATLEQEADTAQNEGEDNTPVKAQEDVEQTPTRARLPENAENGKTPVVAGAWVDTQLEIRPDDQTTRDQEEPAGVAIQDFSRPTTHPDEPQLRKLSEPNLPKSALEAIVQQDREAAEHQYGDSTMNSLEGIIRQNGDETEVETTFDVESTAQEIVEALNAIDDGKPLTQAEKDRRQEDMAIDAMNRHLRLARTSVKEADRGMRRLENRVDHLDNAVLTKAKADDKPTTQISTKPTTQPPSSTTLVAPPKTKDHCPTCGHRNGSAWRALWTELTSCFYTTSPSSRIGIRLTTLGLITLLTLLWYLLETTLCSYYCHPLYAKSMCGSGCDPDAPRYPFVLPTLLFRPVRWLWRPVLDSGFAWWSTLAPDWGYKFWHPELGYAERGPEPIGGWPKGSGGGRSRGEFAGWKKGEAGGFGSAGGKWGESGGSLRAEDGLSAEAAAAGGDGVGSGFEWGSRVAASAVGTAAAAAAETTRKFAESWRDAVDEVGSMWDDEPV
ncbi:hypothetical protein MBLNU230_g3370t1 [Neophaeotheca triangularis]